MMRIGEDYQKGPEHNVNGFTKGTNSRRAYYSR
jgi:hypothetical protein